MLTFTDYNNVIVDLEDELELIGRQITYREIELIGHRDRGDCLNVLANSITLGTSLTDEDKKTLANDVTYQRLLYRKDTITKRLDFIRDHGDFPTEEMNSESVFN